MVQPDPGAFPGLAGGRRDVHQRRRPGGGRGQAGHPLYSRRLWGTTSIYTLNNRIRELRAFFNWLYRRGYTEEHRLKPLKPSKVIQKVIEPLTEEEIGKLFASINPNTVLGARNTAIYSLMLDTGVRLSEVAHLREDNVHLKDRYIKVLGKGNKERIVAFGVSCQRSLIHYAYHYRAEPAHPAVYTFCLSLDGYPLGPSAIRSLTERVSHAAGVPRLHPHLLRHTYATQFLLNGGDVFLLKQKLVVSQLWNRKGKGGEVWIGRPGF